MAFLLVECRLVIVSTVGCVDGRRGDHTSTAGADTRVKPPPPSDRSVETPR
jgi:hypothetical protein